MSCSHRGHPPFPAFRKQIPMSRKSIVTGIIISLFVALLGYVLRLNRENVSASLVALLSSFTGSFLSWLFIQAVLQWRMPAGKLQKAALAVMGCMLISTVPFSITRHFTDVQERIDLLPRGLKAVYFLLLMRGAVVGGFLYFIADLLRMSDMKQQAQLENERLKQENLQAKLSILQQQVSPHFLFNSLGTLRSMVQEKAPRQFIQRLSDVYRYLLSNRMAGLVTLRDELDFTRAYLYILQERLEDALVTEINIGEEALQQKLPPASLQLLVENAVKHNVASVETPLTIRVYVDEEGWLVVSNTLQKRDTVIDSLGRGLGNIRERYRLLAGLNISVTETNHAFTVRTPLIK